MGGGTQLQTLILADNPGISGDVRALQLPQSLQVLHIANTNISGSFNATWMANQGPGFNCLLAYTTPRLCGQLDASLPCSLVQLPQGTNLGE